jgi:hypothetical protein
MYWLSLCQLLLVACTKLVVNGWHSDNRLAQTAEKHFVHMNLWCTKAATAFLSDVVTDASHAVTESVTQTNELRSLAKFLLSPRINYHTQLQPATSMSDVMRFSSSIALKVSCGIIGTSIDCTIALICFAS